MSTVRSCILLIIIEIILLVILYIRWPRPLISIVMPTYNRAEFYLPRAIDSILAQSFRNFELVIIDDGSTDNTKELIKSYMKKDTRIRYFRNDTNRHISYSRNRGNDVARGKYIAVLDSDNVADPHWLHKMIHFIQKHPDKDIYIPERYMYNETKLNQPVHDLKKFYRYPLYYMFFFSAIDNNGILYRRDFVRKHNVRYDETIMRGGDWDFWLKMGYAGASMIRVPGSPLVTIRTHQTNPKEYYQRAKPDKQKITRQLFKFLDIPNNEQINECSIINAALKKMRNYLPTNEWKSAVQEYCSPEKDKKRK